jgi:Protein of unknown function (DUF2783)
MRLVVSANLNEPDRFYEALISAHENLNKEESDAFNARLILLLANHIGDFGTLREALQLAARPAK